MLVLRVFTVREVVLAVRVGGAEDVRVEGVDVGGEDDGEPEDEDEGDEEGLCGETESVLRFCLRRTCLQRR